MLLLNVVNIHAGCGICSLAGQFRPNSGSRDEGNLLPNEMKESDAVSKKVSEKIPGISW